MAIPAVWWMKGEDKVVRYVDGQEDEVWGKLVRSEIDEVLE